jgi:hypothetical protein
VQAAQLSAAARFDPRRSSPVTGVQAAQISAGFSAPIAPALPYTPSALSMPTHLERSSPARSSRGRWIIAAAAFAAIAVIIIVSVVAGISLQQAETAPDGGAGSGE